MQILTFREKEPSQSPSPTFPFCLPLFAQSCTRFQSTFCEHAHTLVLSFSCAADRQRTKLGRQIYSLELQYLLGYHPSADLTLIHFLSLTLKRVHALFRKKNKTF